MPQQAEQAHDSAPDGITPEQAMDRLHEQMKIDKVPNPFITAVKIAFQSLRIRFGRSVITIGGIFFAIAFLASVLTTSIVEAVTAPEGEGVEFTGAGIGMLLELLAEDPRQAWLVTMSLVVCVIGIANAMLMSVTERYKEIGTMKCLGAPDIFVVELFMFESGFQGIVGSVLGAIAGVLLVVLSALINHGFAVLNILPWFQIILNVILGSLAGIVLTLLGASLPSYRATKMVPADAMRTEV
jgi:putative ABC transport system permease protein